MKVCVVGAGYVGLVTGTGLVSLGHDVVCVDEDASKVAAISAGDAPFFEPGLLPLLKEAVSSRKLVASTDLKANIANADLSIIAVGTPSTQDGIDLKYIRQVSRSIGSCLASVGKYHVVAVKSTVVPTTTETVVRQELEEASGLKAGSDFGLAMNPEFLREGSAVADFMNPDRIVIGAIDQRSQAVLDSIYAGFSCPVVHTTPSNAEMIKYTSNALLATLISFSNEISSVCESISGLDEAVVMRGVHLDRRWSYKSGAETVHPAAVTYLRGGVGFGGSCFPKDVKALQAFATDRGISTPVLSSVLTTNEERAGQIVDILAREIGDLLAKRIVILGLAFKPDTDDIRESPGLKIGRELLKQRAKVVVHDPIVPKSAALQALGERVEYTEDVESAFTDSDAVVIATAWNHYRSLDWVAATKRMRSPVVLDGRQILNSNMVPANVKYLTIGRRGAAA